MWGNAGTALIAARKWNVWESGSTRKLMISTVDLSEGDTCPVCDNDSYGSLDAICRARAGNLMCRVCSATFGGMT